LAELLYSALGFKIVVCTISIMALVLYRGEGSAVETSKIKMIVGKERYNLYSEQRGRNTDT
jgi:hypothetical protein